MNVKCKQPQSVRKIHGNWPTSSCFNHGGLYATTGFRSLATETKHMLATFNQGGTPLFVEMLISMLV